MITILSLALSLSSFLLHYIIFLLTHTTSNHTTTAHHYIVSADHAAAAASSAAANSSSRSPPSSKTMRQQQHLQQNSRSQMIASRLMPCHLFVKGTSHPPSQVHHHLQQQQSSSISCSASYPLFSTFMSRLPSSKRPFLLHITFITLRAKTHLQTQNVSI